MRRRDDFVAERDLVLDDKGQERFTRYLPADRSFVNTILNYPYPYVIGRLCWEFPCMIPSDWEAQHLQKPNNPRTVRDLKAALDCAVAKKGVFCLVFHPHGWIRNDQVVELIDHAVAKHGKKVKFLTFKEAQERLSRSKEVLRREALDVGIRFQVQGSRLISINGTTLQVISPLKGQKGYSIATFNRALGVDPTLPFTLPRSFC